jgi:preprotein translocase subunit SecF
MIKSLKMMSIPGLVDASFDFIGKRKFAAILSVALIVGTWGVFLSKGNANLGVDFTGGTVTTFKFDQAPPLETVRAELEKAGFPNAVLTPLQEDGKYYLDMKLKATEGAEQPAQQVVLSLPGNPQIIKADSVGSQIGSELKVKGIKAIVFALIGIIIYISIRFEFAFAMGAIVALAHDVLITVGVFCALGNELSMPIIAALLTIVGYSVNDTIVVFDRIREDLKSAKGRSYAEIANLSINQTLSRTVLTSFTTLLTVIMLLVFGGGAVHDFALALFIGIVGGTYSSIFVATPVVLFWHKEEKVK